MEATIQDKRTYYRAKGVVFGRLWGGGKGAYASHTLTSDNIDDLRKQIEKGIDDGSLDGGMGFESLVGAAMEITTITDIIIDDETYTNKQFEIEFYGNLDEEEQDFLLNCLTDTI